MYVDADAAAQSFAFYGQDEFAIRTNLTLNAGVRYDYFSTFGGTVNPRAGLIYSPFRRTTLKLLYGQAFRAPNAYERDYIAPGYKTNPGLEPEAVRSYELACEQGLSEHWELQASVFYNQIQRLINQTVDPVDTNVVFANLDSVDTRGAGVELRGAWAHGLSTRASYTFTEAVSTGSGALLNNSPKHLAKLGISVPLYRENIYGGLEVQGMSRRTTGGGNALPGFVVANFTLFSRELIKNLDVSARIDNLFDKRYRDPVAPDFTQDTIPQDGRTFRIKLTYRF